MPNWCYNSLIIEGEPDVILDMKQTLNKPFTKKHDTWNRETNQMEVVDTQYTNPVFAFHNIYNHLEDGVSDEEYMTQPDRNLPLQEQLMFKGNHWYDWNVRNWGTKWDVAVYDKEEYPDTELVVDKEDTIQYRFNTAWSPPIEVITKLSNKYPQCEMTLSYEEETGWGGEVVFSDGESTEVEHYQNKCRDCDSTDTLEYCDNDCGEICSKCHYLGEADLEFVAECEVHREYLPVD